MGEQDDRIARNELQVFAELHKLLLHSNVPRNTVYQQPALLPQVLPGHRLWAEAAGKKERFIFIDEIRIMESPQTGSFGSRLYLLPTISGDSGSPTNGS